MNEHPDDRAIQRHLDGELPPAARWQMERHLSACSSCSRAADEYRVVTVRVRELPASVPPPVDLWPGIERHLAELGPRKPAPADLSPVRPLGLRRVAQVLLAAAAMLAIGIGLGRQLAAPPGTADRLAPTVPQSGAVLETYEAGYLAAVGELEALLQSSGARLQPETIATVEENLAIIDGAIAESRAAILADPVNEHLYRQLAMNMQMKIGLLRMLTNAATADL